MDQSNPAGDTVNGKPDDDANPLLRPGSNCWHKDAIDQASLIIDAADYFAAFAQACRLAQHQILILGWDFDRRERLHHDGPPKDFPDQLGDFLAELVHQKKGLHVYLLSWNFNMIYAAERELLPALRLRLQAPPRFHFRLDAQHPPGASHHQKVVIIDDKLAFVGGIDLSRWRWDTSEHAAHDKRRTDADGKHYPPFHDLMLAVEGPAAARLGELARERWRRARGRRVKPPAPVERSAWPVDIPAGVKNTHVGIARTEPAYAGRPAVREVENLYLDMIRAARHFIYIENQYFTSSCLAHALGERLGEPDGPEVILVLPEKTGGWLEQATMDVLRGRMVKQMQRADQHGRLRIYYPFQPGLDGECISVHSKLMIVDDRYLRVGSSNTSNRSMGLDTECDLALESEREEDGVADFIRTCRRRLLAEHLDCDEQALSDAEHEHDGLAAAIESLQDSGRSLRQLDCTVSEQIDQLVPDDSLIDPSEPMSPDYFVTRYVPQTERHRGRRRLQAFLTVLLILISLAAAWRWTPLQDWLSPQLVGELFQQFDSPALHALAAVSGVAIASVLMIPLTFLAVVCGILFPGWLGWTYALLGALLGAATGFLGGKILSRDAIERISGSRISDLSKRIAKRGTAAVALLRLLPIAPFTVFNLVAGASHLGFRQFMVGSTLGLAPGLAGITMFSSSLWELVTEPSWENILAAAAIGALLIGFVLLANRWLRSG